MITGNEVVDDFLESLDARIAGTIGNPTPECRDALRVMRPALRAKAIADPQWFELQISSILVMLDSGIGQG